MLNNFEFVYWGPAFGKLGFADAGYPPEGKNQAHVKVWVQPGQATRQVGFTCAA